jgi:hypothetical protein
MSFRALFDHSGGVVRWVSTAPGDDAVTVHDAQEVGDILRANARDADVDQSGRHFRLAARVPLAIINKARAEGWENDEARWRKWLNDPENRMFRVWGGRV